MEYRTDRTAIIHSAVGKVSFRTQQLSENLGSLMNSIVRDKPSAMKGPFLKSAFLTSSMGPSIMLDMSALQTMQGPE